MTFPSREKFKNTSLDMDLKVHIRDKGDDRDLSSYSVGEEDCVMLCMRLGLVDALFTREEPFLILDDPFVNLDDEHTKTALGLLQRISKTRQIIYLVCNSSRT